MQSTKRDFNFITNELKNLVWWYNFTPLFLIYALGCYSVVYGVEWVGVLLTVFCIYRIFTILSGLDNVFAHSRHLRALSLLFFITIPYYIWKFNYE